MSEHEPSTTDGNDLRHAVAERIHEERMTSGRIDMTFTELDDIAQQDLLADADAAIAEIELEHVITDAARVPTTEQIEAMQRVRAFFGSDGPFDQWRKTPINDRDADALLAGHADLLGFDLATLDALIQAQAGGDV